MAQTELRNPRATSSDGPERDTRLRILEAAERVFAERGFAVARTRDIAARAGVNVAQLHYYFGTKDDLYTSVLRNAVARLREALTGAVGAASGPVERLRAAVGAHFDLLSTRPHLPWLILDAVLHQEERVFELAREDLAPVLATIGPSIAEGVFSGAFRRVDLAQTLVSAFGMNAMYFAARMLVRVVIGENAYEKEALAARREAVLDLLLNGLLARDVEAHADTESEGPGDRSKVEGMS